MEQVRALAKTDPTLLQGEPKLIAKVQGPKEMSATTKTKNKAS